MNIVLLVAIFSLSLNALSDTCFVKLEGQWLEKNEEKTCSGKTLPSFTNSNTKASCVYKESVNTEEECKDLCVKIEEERNEEFYCEVPAKTRSVTAIHQSKRRPMNPTSIRCYFGWDYYRGRTVD